jgi:hypothetical protein
VDNIIWDIRRRNDIEGRGTAEKITMVLEAAPLRSETNTNSDFGRLDRLDSR